MAHPRCSVIVLNWNGEAHLRANLPAVLALDYADFEVWVVDNGSTDGSRATVEELAAAAPPGRLRLLALRKNWGYSQGKNAGARFATGKYLWLLDCDIRPEPDSLARLVEFMESNGGQSRIAMPVLRDAADPTRIQSAGLAFTFHGPSLSVAGALWPAGSKPYPVHAASGGALFVSKAYWKDLGGFDRWAPFHLDDVDLGARALIRGGSCWCVPQALAYHPPQSPEKQTPARRRWEYRWLFQGGPAFILRNFEWKTVALMLPACAAVQILQLLKWTVLRGDWKMPWVWAQAWGALFGSRGRIRCARSRIQARRRRRDSQFLYTRNFWRL